MYQVSKGYINIKQDFEKAVIFAYNQGKENIGGGAVGAVFAIPLINLLGKIGTIIISIGTAVASSIFIFGIKPSNIIKNIIEKIKLRKLDNKTYKEEKRKEKRRENRNLRNKEEKEIESQINIKLSNEQSLFKKQEEIKQDKSKEILVLEHAVTVEDEEYEFPPIEFLKEGSSSSNKNSKKIVADTANKLQRTLYSFGVSAKVENVSVGPTITRYELKPAEGVRVNKIASLADDIALNLAAKTIRIEAPIPGKQAVGIEIPNKEKEIVALRDIIDSSKFKNEKSKLAFALGKDSAGEETVTDISKMPHLLIAGSTGSR